MMSPNVTCKQLRSSVSFAQNHTHTHTRFACTSHLKGGSPLRSFVLFFFIFYNSDKQEEKKGRNPNPRGGRNPLEFAASGAREEDLEAALWSRIPAVHWLQASGSAPGLPGCLTRVGLSGYTAAGQHSTGPGDKWRGGQGKKMQTGHSAHPEHTAKKNSPARFRRRSRSYGGSFGPAAPRNSEGFPARNRHEGP